MTILSHCFVTLLYCVSGGQVTTGGGTGMSSHSLFVSLYRYPLGQLLMILSQPLVTGLYCVSEGQLITGGGMSSHN